MIDLGFEVDLNYILDSIPAIPSDEVGGRQTVMFSATMPSALESLAKKYLHKPAVVTIGVAGQAVAEIDQRVEVIREDAKRGRLIQILEGREFKPPIIVFVALKKSCDMLGKALINMGFSVAILHGGKSQDQREAALAGFKNGTKDILVATDVAG